MSRKAEIPRTAAFAWSHSTSNLELVTGTRAGAVDASFSDDTKLELWNVPLDGDARLLNEIALDSRVYELAWSKPSVGRDEGIIAAGLESGALDLWDASQLKDSNSHIGRNTTHSGPIKSLQFNPHRSELLVTSGTGGDLFVTDLNNLSNPFRLGKARPDDFDSVDWNKQVAHIMATAGNGGFVTVWDIKAKKESLILNNFGRKAASAVVWHPDLPTKLATAISADTDPLIVLWDLRNSSSPERVFKGHDQGVLSLSWSSHDSSLLLSSGKDNRNICWNTHTGEALGEFPIVTNWTFETRWHPRQADFFATASFDGKISVGSIQSTNTMQPEESVDDGADFFSKPHATPTIFSLPSPPKWMRPLVGAKFGFGGKLVRLSTSDKSRVTITKMPDGDTGLPTVATLEPGKIKKICQDKATSQGGDYKVMSVLIDESPRQGLLAQLGFEKPKHSKTSLSEAAQPQADVFDESASKDAHTLNSFNLHPPSQSQADLDISKALILGSFEDALDICIRENRLADAMVIANCGGQRCVEKAQSAYFKQQNGQPEYLRLLASIVNKDLWDIVRNADIDHWTEIMATICTYAEEEQFPNLCEALGERLEAKSEQDACFCYLAGSKLNKIVPIWLKEMEANEQSKARVATDESAFSIHVQALQEFIEKVSVFRHATAYENKEDNLDSLYARYVEYADIIASYGHTNLASQYLSLLPDSFSGAENTRNRLRQAALRPDIAKPRNADLALARDSSAAYRSTRALAQSPVAFQPVNSYQHPAVQSYQPASLFTPSLQATTPAQVNAPTVTGQSSSLTGPPRSNANGTNWNDLPDSFGKPPVSRRGTPGAIPIKSPFNPISNGSQVPSSPPPPRTTALLPPPPLASRIQQPIPGQNPEASPRAASAKELVPQVAPARTISPYNPPPSGHAPSKYAPASTNVGSPPVSKQAGSYAPQVVPSSMQEVPDRGRPPTGPPPTGPPPTSRPPPGPPPAGPPRSFGTAHTSLLGAASSVPPGAALKRELNCLNVLIEASAESLPVTVEVQRTITVLTAEISRVKGLAPANFMAHVTDTERRLSLLFDALRNDLINAEHIVHLQRLAQAIESRDFTAAQQAHTELVKQVEGPWLVGLKRLISMSRATPV